MRTEFPSDSSQLQRFTNTLVAVASMMIELALAQPEQTVPVSLAVGFAPVVLVALIQRLLDVGVKSPARRQAAHCLIAALLVAVFAFDPVRSAWFGTGRPLELWMLIALRDATLLLAAFSSIPICLRAAGALSAAGVLFAGCLVESPVVLALMAIFSVLGGIWLVLLHWNSIQQQAIAGSTRRFPLFAVALACGLVVCGAMVTAIGPQQTWAILGELVPSSGGTGQLDPNARAGANDGQALVEGKQDAMSTGFVQSEIYLNSEERSLYDAISDLYGDTRMRKDVQRAIALDASQIRERRQRARNSGGEQMFSLLRRQPKQRRLPAEAQTAAELFVSGPGPLHLRLRSFGRFDGMQLVETEPTIADSKLRNARVAGSSSTSRSTPAFPKLSSMTSKSESSIPKLSRLHSRSMPFDWRRSIASTSLVSPRTAWLE